MSEDASLDDFLGDESSGQSESADAVASTDGTESGSETESAAETESTDDGNAERAPADDADPEPTADIEPAKTTYAWNGEGGTCEGCGEAVERRWQQGGRLVCIECKDWDQA